MTCALCGSTLTYQGLTEVYCSGPSTCPNVDKDVLAARKIEEEARNLAWPVAGPFWAGLVTYDFTDEQIQEAEEEWDWNN